MRFPNYIVFDRNKYEDDKAFWSEVACAMRILIKNDYVVSFRYEDLSYYRLEYEYNDEEIAEFKTNWLEMEEYEKYLDWKFANEREEKNND